MTYIHDILYIPGTFTLFYKTYQPVDIVIFNMEINVEYQLGYGIMLLLCYLFIKYLLCFYFYFLNFFFLLFKNLK